MAKQEDKAMVKKWLTKNKRKVDDAMLNSQDGIIKEICLIHNLSVAEYERLKD